MKSRTGTIDAKEADRLELRFPYNEAAQVRLKRIRGAHFDAKLHCWIVPVSSQAFAALDGIANDFSLAWTPAAKRVRKDYRAVGRGLGAGPLIWGEADTERPRRTVPTPPPTAAFWRRTGGHSYDKLLESEPARE